MTGVRFVLLNALNSTQLRTWYRYKWNLRDVKVYGNNDTTKFFSSADEENNNVDENNNNDSLVRFLAIKKAN